MTTITFDTHKYVKDLESSGMPTSQAEALVRAQQDVLSQALDTQLATKSDLLEAKTEIKLEVAALRGEMLSIKWMIGALVALAAANFAKQFF